MKRTSAAVPASAGLGSTLRPRRRGGPAFGREEHLAIGPALRPARGLWVLGFVVAVAHVAYTTLGLGHGAVDFLATPWVPFAVFLVCGAASLARGLSHRHERSAWLMLGTGLVLYAAGQVYYALAVVGDPTAAFPTGADVAWLSLHVSALIAIVLLVRAQRSRPRAELWLDGVIGGCAIASLGVVLIWKLVMDPASALHAAPANVAFALADLLVVGFGVGCCGLLGWRPPRSLVVLIVGFAAQGLQDSWYLHELVSGTLEYGTLLDSCWLLGLLAITAAAVWPLPRASQRRDARPATLVAFPLLFALIAVFLAGYEALAVDVSALPVALTVLALLAVVARFALTFRAHVSMLASSERDALTDTLTGLGNRRKLLRDAERALAAATPQRPVTLAIFDLDGFKLYNDSYGHPAGDTLLARLGDKLAQAVVPWGEAYRLGGDEFCLLLHGHDAERHAALEAAGAALTEQGEAFTVRASYGSVVAPTDEDSLSAALRLADERLYAAKDNRPCAPANQTCGVLRQILLESEPELDNHADVVGRLAERVARRLGLRGEEVRMVATAAELHDIGKIAIPDAILHKPAPLTNEEWEFMKRHTLIGERFLASIPSLREAARLVRSSHERIDGRGYPDGLADQEIPLGARIIFTCDAYDAMTTDRPYRAAISNDDALAELRRHAGTQFDASVVEAFCAEILGPESEPTPNACSRRG